MSRCFSIDRRRCRGLTTPSYRRETYGGEGPLTCTSYFRPYNSKEADSCKWQRISIKPENQSFQSHPLFTQRTACNTHWQHDAHLNPHLLLCFFDVSPRAVALPPTWSWTDACHCVRTRRCWWCMLSEISITSSWLLLFVLHVWYHMALPYIRRSLCLRSPSHPLAECGKMSLFYTWHYSFIYIFWNAFFILSFILKNVHIFTLIICFWSAFCLPSYCNSWRYQSKFLVSENLLGNKPDCDSYWAHLLCWKHILRSQKHTENVNVLWQKPLFCPSFFEQCLHVSSQCAGWVMWTPSSPHDPCPLLFWITA